MHLFPEEKIPFNNTLLSVITAYYHAEAYEKADELVDKLTNKVYLELDYYFSLSAKYSTGTKDLGLEIQTNLYTLQELYKITTEANRVEKSGDIEANFMKYMQQYR